MKCKFIALLGILSISINSCTKNFSDVNTNPKSLTIDRIDNGTFPLVLKRAFYGAVAYSSSGFDWHLREHGGFADIFSNYVTHLHPDFYSDNFTFNDAWIQATFNYFYQQVAPYITFSEDYARSQNLEIEEAIAKVWKVYAYSRMTDLFGAIPYLSVGNGENAVPYDPQDVIYNNFFKTLDTASNIFSNNAGKMSMLGSNDVIFSGSVDKWARLANSLRLRLALRISGVDPQMAKAEAEKAVNLGVVEDNADNGYVKTTTFWYNYYITISNWPDFRMSGDVESIYKGYLDPRIQSYFAPAVEPDPSDDPAGITFNFEGVRNGLSQAQKLSANYVNLCSNLATPYTTPGTAGPSWPLVRAAESYFLRAEGALLGWDMKGSAKDLYEQGITASLNELGYEDKDLAGAQYSTSTNTPVSYDGTTPPASVVPVAFASDAGTQLEQIHTQKWIALFPDTEEAWTERRRTGYPTFMSRQLSLNADISASQLPRRLPYPGSEYVVNGESVKAAVTSLGGPDDATTRLWWDKK
jgi:hypothetical protein